MLKLLSQFKGPRFDFLIVPTGKCWDRRRSVKSEYFHHSEARLFPDSIVSIFVSALTLGHPNFAYFGPTEYHGKNLIRLQNALVERIQSIRSCRTPKQFEAAINRYFIGECDEFLGDWRSKWRRVRNELETVGLLILRMAEQAEREHQSLLVLGI